MVKKNSRSGAANPRRKEHIMKRIYGNEKTHLTLTEKAEQIYSNTDPLRIIEEEYEDEDGEKKYRYFIAAYFGDKAMTEVELNAFLEYMADEVGD